MYIPILLFPSEYYPFFSLTFSYLMFIAIFLRESDNNNGRIHPEFKEANLESDGETSIDVGRGKIDCTRFTICFFAFFGGAS